MTKQQEDRLRMRIERILEDYLTDRLDREDCAHEILEAIAFVTARVEARGTEEGSFFHQ